MTATTPFWRSIEAIHDVVYFAPGVKERFQEIGLKGYWMGYVASRSAALGTPAAEVIVATFHGFAPSMVRRAIPDAWSMATREDILRVRMEVARDALTPALDGTEAARVARELASITTGLDLAGKPLAAGQASLPRPDDDVELLWWAASVLREYRGDCHVAVLTAAGLDGAAANALADAAGLAPAGQQKLRGWTDDEWAAAIGRLAVRGWVDADGAITDSGTAARQQIEDATDRVCAAGMDTEATARGITIEAALVDVARAVVATGVVTFPNPTGVASP